MRVVGQQRIPAGGEFAAHHPVVAADIFTGPAQLGRWRFRGSVQLCEDLLLDTDGLRYLATSSSAVK